MKNSERLRELREQKEAEQTREQGRQAKEKTKPKLQAAPRSTETPIR